MATPKEILERNAGAVASRRARSTGTVVTVYRTEEAGLGTHEGPDNAPTPYATVCEDHSTIVCHETRKAALSWIAAPEGFCDDCRALLAAKETS
jgi:hypothetical protein